MTSKQTAFVRYKLEGLSNRAAVVAAGYSMAGAKQMGTMLMKHPGVRAALDEGGYLGSPKEFVRNAFSRSASTWNSVALSMPKRSYSCPMEFLSDAMNCKELPTEVRVAFAAVLLPYQHRKL